jgi:hypothetical protein
MVLANRTEDAFDAVDISPVSKEPDDGGGIARERKAVDSCGSSKSSFSSAAASWVRFWRFIVLQQEGSLVHRGQIQAPDTPNFGVFHRRRRSLPHWRNAVGAGGEWSWLMG